MKREVITLCGSTRFQDAFERVQRELTLEGKVVLSCGVFGNGRDASIFNDADAIEAAAIKRILDDVHIDKIAMSDAIYVVNPNGYIGNSTWREIVYAAMTGKGIYSIANISQESIFSRMDEETHLAERFASWQLDSIVHNPYSLTGATVSFAHKGIEVYDPWIRETQQGDPWAWRMHREADYQIDPRKHYGKRKFARYVFEAMQALAEYRTLHGCNLSLPDYDPEE
ncbi:hypothetical protein [Xiamenia xianingshaonis]|uniref:hypothetical protein n=1 Tax=Xiamenia xianingshaonis TaxID=2682776 RepID=UPI0021BD1C27|nr:hypothetical protein [Xiamenia xianingshaonis]